MRRLLAALLVAFCAAAQAQTYPEKPVRMVVPFPPGGPLDFVARLFSEKLAASLGKPFLIENRSGAGGNIGMDAVAKSAPDGYTLLWALDSMLTVNPLLHAAMEDPLQALQPVALIVENTSALVVPAALGVRSSAEFVKLSQSRDLFYASAGPGSPGHRYMEFYKLVTGAKLTHVPYKGNAPAVQGLLAGETQAFITPISAVLLHLRSGRLAALAVTSAKRSAVVPEVPTMAEVGYPQYQATSWYSVHVPAGTPEPVVQTLYREFAAAMRAPDIRARLGEGGFEAVVDTGEAVTARARAERKLWQDVVRASGMKLN